MHLPHTGRRTELYRADLYIFDIGLIILTAIALVTATFFQTVWAYPILAALSFLGVLPVLLSAAKSLLARRVSVDLLASIALIFSLASHEWFSAAFITLMLAFARVFDHFTDERAKKIIESLMKYHVEQVHIQIGETVKEVHISEVKSGDLVVVDAGDRMPVDGTVVSGAADVDESSLTGESELVPKKARDKVFTSTVSQSGSLIVRAEKIGADTTLSRIIALVEEASRNKSRAERTADTFTQWYIGVSLLGSIALYVYGLSPNYILSILLVVCADDIAVAVPLAFTAAIARTAKRGVIVKGSAALEQMSRVKYILTDKTGTLTRGKPKIVDVKAYDSVSADKVMELAGMGASESRHAVSHAILEYLEAAHMKIHAADESEEISGQGIVYRHGSNHMLMGRLSFMEHKKVRIPEELLRDVAKEKDAGRGIAILAQNGQAIGLISYRDELRPHARAIIAETKELGVRSWVMLTGDNERAAAGVASELGIKHFHANMTPESKVEFIRKFKHEHGRKDIVAYIGDGVNDAASLALVDVSIAMGGIGSDAAIAAADITIMKDRLNRLPIILRTAQTVRNIMWQCFAIWAVTNAIGLTLVGLGVIGPAGAAAYNFLTDFIPIGNALRVGRRVK
jgi:Cd2+/Zn2+-exporting ATPase